MDTSLSSLRELVQEQKRLDDLMVGFRESLRTPTLAELGIPFDALRYPLTSALLADIGVTAQRFTEWNSRVAQSVAEMNRQADAIRAVTDVRLDLPSAVWPMPMLPLMPPPPTYSELNDRLVSLSEGMYAPPPPPDADDEGEYSGGHGWGFIPPTV